MRVTNATANPPCTQATGPGRAIHSRRRFLSALVPVGLTLAMGIDPMVASASPLKSDKLVHRMAEIDPSLAPDSASYDPTDERLRRAGRLIQQALNASTIEEEERTWTQIIDEYADVDALWRDDVLGRAYGNRGNCRSRQGKVEAALRDYDESIRICPWSVDPVLNRGVLFESQKMYEQAEADYRAVLKVSVDDPVAWNNLGNAQMGAEKFEEAIKALDKAVKLGGNNYAFAMANKAICLYAMGDDREAEREMTSLLRRFPEFSDVRASLGSLLWAKGDPVSKEKAEENWLRVNEPSYRSVDWLRNQRRWPRRLVDAAEAYLTLN